MERYFSRKPNVRQYSIAYIYVSEVVVFSLICGMGSFLWSPASFSETACFPCVFRCSDGRECEVFVQSPHKQWPAPCYLL